ncbi:hypothetical protein AWZ03_015238, partial [Drosophila navojoa]
CRISYDKYATNFKYVASWRITLRVGSRSSRRAVVRRSVFFLSTRTQTGDHRNLAMAYNARNQIVPSRQATVRHESPSQ